MQTDFQFEDGILGAKLKILALVKEYLPIKQDLINRVHLVSEKYEVEFDELWEWTLGELFGTIEPPKQNLAKRLSPKTQTVLGQETPKALAQPRPKPKKVAKPKALPAPDSPEEPKPDIPKVIRRASANHTSYCNSALQYQKLALPDKLLCLKKTQNHNILTLGTHDANYLVRCEAARNAETPQAELQRLVEKDTNIKTRRIAIRGITGQTFLEKIALNIGDIRIRQHAIRKLTNLEALNQILEMTTPIEIAEAARETIKKLNRKS